MAAKNNPKSRERDIVVQDLKNEVLIYDLTTNKAFCLNKTSAMVWNLCNGNNSIAEITRKVSQKLKQPVTDDLVWLALDQFKQDNLLTNNQKVEIEFGGLSRREVIKKVGFATMVMIPIVSSIVAPTAAMAQSGGFAPGSRTQGQTCTATADCASSAPVCAFIVSTITRKCCTSGDTLRADSGRVVAFGGTTGTCATFDCNGLGNSAACCSGSSTLTSCTDFPPPFVGALSTVSFACSCT